MPNIQELGEATNYWPGGMGLIHPMENITYQVEPYELVRPEIEPLLQDHWEEIALNKDKIKLSVDWEKYDTLAKEDRLHIVTVRADRKLIGYWIGYLACNLHYKNDPMAFTDIYRILPEYRRGRIGINLFKFVEKSLRGKVVQLVTVTKLHKDVGRLFEYLGWKETERTFTKYIGD